jgi:hypothetical protein
MISATTEPGFADLLKRLAARAGTLAKAKAERDALARRGDPARWRKAALVWPLFAKG